MPFSLSNLKAYLNNLENTKIHLFTSIEKLSRQRGQSCKITALGNLLNYFYNANFTSIKPLPIYKHTAEEYRKDDDAPAVSLRAIAKKYAGSRVGEMYTLEMFNNLIHAVGKETHDKALEEATVTVEHFYKEQMASANADYISRLKALVDAGKTPPIIFFDVDKEGYPCLDGDGSRQHAAIVFGYLESHDSSKLEFIVGHWGKFYLFDAQSLAIAADRLANYCESETFYKLKFLDHQSNTQGKCWLTSIEEVKETLLNDVCMPEQNVEVLLNVAAQAEDVVIASEFSQGSSSFTFFASKRRGYANTEKAEGFRSAICIVQPAFATQHETTNNSTPTKP